MPRRPSSGLALALGHFALVLRQGVHLTRVVIVRRHLHEPVRADLDDAAHVLLCSQYQLVVANPARHRLGKTACRMNMHRLRILDGAIMPLSLQAGNVVEKARRDGLADLVLVAARRELDLGALAQALNLLADVARALHRAQLAEILEAPLLRVLGVTPLVVAVHEREVIARVAHVKVLARGVGEHLLVLWRKENGVAHREHRHDGDNLL
mmetsp:Transcript_22956/g.70945  ORF Transcript_22956/g.70945 Transcript_22956/m.70945 type:complete len:210 (-) Transcript_22956:1864-2493(-)